MSRITRGRIEAGDNIAAADLNNRFDDYTQPGALNEQNTRDAAFDLPQVKKSWFAQRIEEHTLGELSLLHTSFNTVAGLTADGPGHVVQNFSAVPSVLNFGLGGQAIGAEDIMRLYWDLSVQPIFTGTPWTAIGSISNTTVPDVPKTGTTAIATNNTVWVIYPEWDITSSGLTNFVPVPGQGDFRTPITGPYFGEALSDCGATTVVPAWLQSSQGAADGGVPAGSLKSHGIGWRGISGSWHYSGAEDGPVTVFGLRWIIRGVLHSYKNATLNYLVHDFQAAEGGAASLRYTSGKAQVLFHRVQ